MVIIEDKTQENIAYFPKNSSNLTEENLTLLLKSEITLKEYRIDNLIDDGNLYDYFVIRLDLSDMEEGEYIYTLFSQQCQNIGLLRLGKIDQSSTTEYTNNTKYKEYNF